MFFNKDIETMSRADMDKLQLTRLQWLVDYCLNNIPFYHERLTKAGIDSGDKIKTLSDIQYIPFTTKEDIRDNYPFNMMARPMKDIVRIHASSGTTGKPTVGVYTKNDLDNWAEQVARICAAVDVTDEDVVQISFGYGLFTGALGLHGGLERLGATVIPASSGNTEKQLMLMRDFGVTGLVATPSYAIYLAEMLKEENSLDLYRKLKHGILGSEPCTDDMRNTIEGILGIHVSDNYGMTELVGPGVSGECKLRTGLHFNEDAYLPEIIDPETGERRAEGETGELVVTTLIREGAPVLRYRTRDITKLDYSTCACGRTGVRMEKIMGRTDDMLIIRGVNVFPSQIATVLAEFPQVSAHYQLVLTQKKFMDRLEVKVEFLDESLLDHYGQLEALTEAIRDRMLSVLGLSTKVTLVGPKTLERFQGKAKRILDLRNV